MGLLSRSGLTEKIRVKEQNNIKLRVAIGRSCYRIDGESPDRRFALENLELLNKIIDGFRYAVERKFAGRCRHSESCIEDIGLRVFFQPIKYRRRDRTLMKNGVQVYKLGIEYNQFFLLADRNLLSKFFDLVIELIDLRI